MSPDDGGLRDEPDPETVEALLRHLRGRGPDAMTGGSVPDEPSGAPADGLSALLDAIVDSAEVVHPPFDEDPAAIRLGLVPPSTPDALVVSLRELAHRLGGQLDIELLTGDDPGEGGWRPRAVARTLNEVVLVVAVGDERLAVHLDRVAGVFATRPTTTAVTLVSTATWLAVVVTEADCVAAIDPRTGWAAPALPRDPEPFTIALGRHLERSLPRWDEIARLDEMLVLTRDERDLVTAVGRVVADRLGRPARIPTKRAALAELAPLTAGAVAEVIEDVQSGLLAGDDLLGRIRGLAGAGAP
jgi:hypothetical protein